MPLCCWDSLVHPPTNSCRVPTMCRAEGLWGAGLRGAQGRFPGQLRPTSFFSWHLISASSQREEATESPAGTWSLGDPPSPRGKCLLLSKDAPLNFRKTWSIGYRRKERGQDRRGEGRRGEGKGGGRVRSGEEVTGHRGTLRRQGPASL